MVRKKQPSPDLYSRIDILSIISKLISHILCFCNRIHEEYQRLLPTNIFITDSMDVLLKFPVWLLLLSPTTADERADTDSILSSLNTDNDFLQYLYYMPPHILFAESMAKPKKTQPKNSNANHNRVHSNGTGSSVATSVATSVNHLNTMEVANAYPSVDIWSLGCCIADIFYGLPLFSSTSVAHQLLKTFQILGYPDWNCAPWKYWEIDAVFKSTVQQQRECDETDRRGNVLDDITNCSYSTITDDDDDDNHANDGCLHEMIQNEAIVDLLRSCLQYSSEAQITYKELNLFHRMFANEVDQHIHKMESRLTFADIHAMNNEHEIENLCNSSSTTVMVGSQTFAWTHMFASANDPLHNENERDSASASATVSANVNAHEDENDSTIVLSVAKEMTAIFRKSANANANINTIPIPIPCSIPSTHTVANMNKTVDVVDDDGVNTDHKEYLNPFEIRGDSTDVHKRNHISTIEATETTQVLMPEQQQQHSRHSDANEENYSNANDDACSSAAPTPTSPEIELPQQISDCVKSLPFIDTNTIAQNDDHNNVNDVSQEMLGSNLLILEFSQICNLKLEHFPSIAENEDSDSRQTKSNTYSLQFILNGKSVSSPMFDLQNMMKNNDEQNKVYIHALLTMQQCHEIADLQPIFVNLKSHTTGDVDVSKHQSTAENTTVGANMNKNTNSIDTASDIGRIKLDVCMLAHYSVLQGFYHIKAMTDGQTIGQIYIRVLPQFSSNHEQKESSHNSISNTNNNSNVSVNLSFNVSSVNTSINSSPYNNMDDDKSETSDVWRMFDSFVLGKAQ